MSNLPVPAGFGDGLSSRAVTRQASREVARARAYGSVVSAGETAKIEAVAQVTEAALLATSHISAMEALLVSRTPHAEARLKHIADAGCVGMAGVVFETGRKI